MKHYTEVDLLEVHYLPPEALIPVHKHLSACRECMSKYDSLQKKLRSSAEVSCSRIEQKPATFWDRQRFSIMRKIQSHPRQVARKPAIGKLLAVAAMLLIMVSGVVLVREYSAADPAPQGASDVLVEQKQAEPDIDAAADVFQELRALNDPWSSEELSPFRGAVEWETWTTEPASDPRGTL
ncbi:MAG TPA: hypothetical protein VMS12_01255 [Thermoanaerobaculia bacterium]|nr:hypothetical protein [Thermoanaerobaculia bacterium]